jgi:hypothetical protein
MRTLCVIIGLVIAGPAMACFVPPPEIFRSHRALVDEAKAIVLFEVVASGSSCTLKVVRVLKGDGEDVASVRCWLPGDGDWITDFASHTDTSFWEGFGRLGVNTDCSVNPPGFVVGQLYLGLLGIAPDTKQFEQIGSETDRWLAFVEDQLRGE